MYYTENIRFQKEKNKTPIIPFDERVAILEAIKYVDKVVVQENKNKLEAWQKYKFNKMFQHIGGKRRKDTDHKAQHKNKLILRNMLLAPLYEAVEQALVFSLLCTHSLIMLITPSLVSFIMLDDFGLPFSNCL